MSEPTEPALSAVTDDIGVEHASAALVRLVSDDRAMGSQVPRAAALLLHLIDIDAKQKPTA